MSILKKFNLLLIALSVVFASILLVVVNVLVLQGYTRLETQMAQKNLERLKEAYAQMYTNLDTKVMDWSWWDDTYKYAQDKNEAFVKSNISTTSLNSLKLDSMMYFNAEKELVSTTSIAPDQSELVPTPETMINHFSKNSPLLEIVDDEDSNYGLLKSDNSIYAFIVRPILQSTKKGPRAGYIVFIQPLSQYVLQIDEVLKLSISFEPANTIINYQESWLETDDLSNIFGRITLKDYKDEMVGTLRFTMPKEVSIQGRENIILVTEVLIAIFTASMIINYLLLRSLVINRLLRVNRDVANISSQTNHVHQIAELGGDDELSELTKNINTMLLRLQSSNTLAQTGRQNVHSYIDIVGVMVIAIDQNQKIILANKKAGEILGVDPSEMVGMNWFDNFIPEENRKTLKESFAKLMQGMPSIEHYENEVVTKSGARRLIDWHNAVIKNEAGEVVSSLSAGEDVTDRKTTEKAKDMHAMELERLNELMVGRELQMIEMKKKLDALEAKK